MVYSSDSKVNPHIQAMDKIDLLIHECTKAEAITSTHSSLKQLAEFYDWNKVDRAVMVHLTDGEDYEVVMSSLPDRIRNKISFGEDLIRLQPYIFGCFKKIQKPLHFSKNYVIIIIVT